MVPLCGQLQALPLNAIKINWTAFFSFQGGPESTMPDVSSMFLCKYKIVVNYNMGSPLLSLIFPVHVTIMLLYF